MNRNTVNGWIKTDRFSLKKYPKKYYKPHSTDILMTSGNDLFSLEQIEVEKTSVNTTIIFEEIHKVIREHLSKEIDTDSTDGVFDLLKNSTNCLQEDFNWRRQQQEKVLPRH